MPAFALRALAGEVGMIPLRRDGPYVPNVVPRQRRGYIAENYFEQNNKIKMPASLFEPWRAKSG